MQPTFNEKCCTRQSVLFHRYDFHTNFDKPLKQELSANRKKNMVPSRNAPSFPSPLHPWTTWYVACLNFHLKKTCIYHITQARGCTRLYISFPRFHFNANYSKLFPVFFEVFFEAPTVTPPILLVIGF